MISSCAPAMSAAVSSFSMPIAPWVSTLMRCPSLRAAFSRRSAAMYVCATPVGHAVTATILIAPS